MNLCTAKFNTGTCSYAVLIGENNIGRISNIASVGSGVFYTVYNKFTVKVIFYNYFNCKFSRIVFNTLIGSTALNFFNSILVGISSGIFDFCKFETAVCFVFNCFNFVA